MYLFGSPNHANAGQFCRINTRLLTYLFHGSDIGAMKPVETKGCIVIWAHNAKESVPVEYHQYRQIKKKGGVKFIVVDPKRIDLVDELEADLWLPIRPGTDTALALGWANVIINEELYDKEFVARWVYGFEPLRERCSSIRRKGFQRSPGSPKKRLSKQRECLPTAGLLLRFPGESRPICRGGT